MVELSEQRYDFECRRCGQPWSWLYEIRRFTWGTDEMVLWSRDGADVSSPLAGVCCPYCGGYRTRGWRVP